MTWFAGLSESAVPVYAGDRILGFLETGEVMLKNPSKKHFAGITRQLRAWGYKANWKRLERAYFRSCVLSPRRYRAMLRLLNIFAEHLSILSNQLVVMREKDESANMARARSSSKRIKQNRSRSDGWPGRLTLAGIIFARCSRRRRR